MSAQYTNLARLYDRLNTEVDYAELADFLLKKTSIVPRGRPELILDLACGTGKLTAELAARGFDMTGVDISEDMLEAAAERASEAGVDILFLNQSMTDFELYGTVQAVYCCFDSLNYLTRSGELAKCFALVHNYLEPNCIFIFDVNTEHKFKNIYSQNSYILEADGIFCAWQNYYNEKTRLCDFYLTFFEEQPDGSYLRSEESQRERCYSIKHIEKCLTDTGFEVLEVLGDDRMSALKPTDDRAYFIARAIKH